MILLVVGLVAVIVVVLIAVFLSIRLGRGDEDDEADLRPSRSLRHDQHDQAESWRDRDSRHVPAPASRGAARSGRGEPSGYSSRGPARDRAPRGRDVDAAPRRPAREAAGYRQTASARSPVGAQARGRYDAGPARRPAGGDHAPASHPSMDFGPAGGQLSGDHPSADFPVPDYEATDNRRDRQDTRRKAAPAPAGAKSKSRQRGKRDDDSDWPSTEWDKLSDEQYWAELSADKPLASMARPARPAASTVAAPAGAGVKARPEARDARAAGPDRDAPSRKEPSRRERNDQREPATERLPVRAAAHPAGPSLPPPRREPDLSASARSYPGPRNVPDPGHRSSRDTGPQPARTTGPHAARDTGPQSRPDHRRRDDTGPQSARDRDLAMLSGLASAPPPIPGALDDDPLTSPSFSLKAVPATDTRSYSNARKHAQTTGNPAPELPAATAAGSYLAAGYSDPGYAYHAAPPAAPAAEWYSAPAAEVQAPAYGDPYAHTGQANGSSVTGYPDGQATAGYANYQADPLRVYTPPGYEAAAPYAEPAPPAAYPAMPAAGSMPYSDGYPAQPYPEQPGYPDGYSAAAGYSPGYEAGYAGDPYAAGGYGPYPPQG